jgi:hypothetical protein
LFSTVQYRSSTYIVLYTCSVYSITYAPDDDDGEGLIHIVVYMERV